MSRKWQVYVGSAALIFGLAFSQLLPGQLQAQGDISNKNLTLVETIKQLEADISAMEAEISLLRQETEALQNSEAGDRDISMEIREDMQLQLTEAGLTELTGEGILITLNDNARGAAAAKAKDPDNYRPNDYIIHDKNLLYLVNELKQAGAQGIAINNQRVAASSDIRCVGTVIMVNSTRVAPPFEIAALGNSGRLKNAMDNSREFHYLTQNDFPVTVETQKNLVLPPYTGSFNPKFMVPANA